MNTPQSQNMNNTNTEIKNAIVQNTVVLEDSKTITTYKTSYVVDEESNVIHIFIKYNSTSPPPTQYSRNVKVSTYYTVYHCKDIDELKGVSRSISMRHFSLITMKRYAKEISIILDGNIITLSKLN